MPPRRLALVGAALLLAVAGAVSAVLLSREPDVRVLEFAGTQVSVPATWPEGDPSQWCRRDSLGPTWSAPSPTTLVGCDPSTGYGVTFRRTLASTELDQHHVYGGEYPGSAWVAMVRANESDEWGVLVVTETRAEAQAIIDTIE